MHRFTVSLALAIVVLLGLVATVAQSTDAQEATPDTTTMMAMTTHPLVGTWRWDNDPAVLDDDSYGIFTTGGSYLEVTRPDNAGVGVGAWTPTGERTADVITVFIDADASEAFAPGTGTFLMSVTVDASGDAVTATADLQVRDPDGTVTFEGAGWTFTGTRVSVAPLPDFGAWGESSSMAGTPTP